MGAGKTLFKIIQVLVIVLLGYYLVYLGLVRNWDSLGETGWQVGWAGFCGSLVAVSLIFAANSQIWCGIVRSLSGDSRALSPYRAMYIWFISNLGRYLPGKVWQIAGMAVLARMYGVPALDATAAAVVGQVIHLLAGVAVALVFLPGELAGPFLPLARWAWLGLIPVLAFLWPPLLNRLLALLARFRGAEKRVVCSLRARDLTAWFLLNVAVWLAYGACFYYFILSVIPGSPVELSTAIGVYATGYIIGFAVIFAPGGLGVRETMFAALLASAVGGQAQATVVALVSRLWLTLAELVPVTVVLLASGLPRKGRENSERIER